MIHGPSCTTYPNLVEMTDTPTKYHKASETGDISKDQYQQI